MNNDDMIKDNKNQTFFFDNKEFKFRFDNKVNKNKKNKKKLLNTVFKFNKEYNFVTFDYDFYDGFFNGLNFTFSLLDDDM